LSEEEGFLEDICNPPFHFMLQMSNLDDKQFLFLALNCHKQCQWNRISEKTKEDAFDSFLVGRQGCDTEYMALALLKTGLAYRGAYITA
jgi:hypothetical protein